MAAEAALKALNLPLFPKGKEAIRGAIRSLASDHDALLFGLDIEDRSYGLYTRLARETKEAHPPLTPPSPGEGGV